MVNLFPDQIDSDYKVDIYIQESLPITDLRVPETEIYPVPQWTPVNKITKIEWTGAECLTKVHVRFHPSNADLKLIESMSNIKNGGMSGQLIVQYDVSHRKQANEFQIVNGFFPSFHTR